jgi:flagellar biogenesis protein FliO
MKNYKLIGFGVIVVGGIALFLAYRLMLRLMFGVALVALAVWLVRRITHNGRQS